jgi:hypothetical protein
MVNGLAQSTASLVRTVLPTVGGSIYSASLGWDALGSLRLHVVYVLSCSLAATAFWYSYKLPAQANVAPDRRKRPQAVAAAAAAPVHGAAASRQGQSAGAATAAGH